MAEDSFLLEDSIFQTEAQFYVHQNESDTQNTYKGSQIKPDEILEGSGDQSIASLHTEYNDDDLDQLCDQIESSKESSQRKPLISQSSKSNVSSRESSNASRESKLLTPLSEYNDELPVREYISVTQKTREVIGLKGL